MRKVVTVRFWIETPEDEVERWRQMGKNVTSDEFIENDVKRMVCGIQQFHDYSDILSIETMEMQNEKCTSM